MSKSKVAIVTPYLNYFGGVEVMNQYLAKALKLFGYEVDFITIEKALKHSNTSLINNTLYGKTKLVSDYFNRINEKYDFVIANGEYSFGIKHPQKITYFHGSYFGFRKNLSQYLSLLQKIKLKRNEILQFIGSKESINVCVSDYLLEVFDKQNIKIDSVIENCIDLQKFKPLPKIRKNKKILFVGSYNHYGKGFDILQKIASKGYEIDCITNTNTIYGLNTLSNLNNSKMQYIYNQYGLFILPSRFEGLQVTPLEAMACKTPILLSNVGLSKTLAKQIPEVVIEDGKFESITEWTDRIDYLMDSKLNGDIVERCYEYVLKNHGFEKYLINWKNFIGSFIC